MYSGILYTFSSSLFLEFIEKAARFQFNLKKIRSKLSVDCIKGFSEARCIIGTNLSATIKFLRFYMFYILHIVSFFCVGVDWLIICCSKDSFRR
ncbi:hypothetical protein ABIB50_002635 [Mucilaginibacter sp. UYCu711]